MYATKPNLIVLCFSVMAWSLAFGQEDKQVVQDEMKSTTIKITDPDDFPLEGATVTLQWMSPENSSSSYAWPLRLGEPPQQITNSQGEAVLPFPKIIKEQIEIDRLYVKVEHPDYVTRFEYHQINSDIEIRLANGFRIAATAINGETGEPITKNLYPQAGWKLTENGTLVSSVYPREPAGVRLFTIEDGQTVLFSDLIIVEPGDRSRVLLKDVKLWPGVEVNGVLDESIPRPILNGTVEARISVEVFNSEDFGRVDSTWMDFTKIQEDGRFSFKSLPRGTVLQLLPVCDHWCSRPLTLEEIQEFYPSGKDSWNLPQLFKMEANQLTPVLQMVPAVTLRAQVIDHNKNPVPGANVAVSPNKSWFKSDGRTLGGGLLNEYTSYVAYHLNPTDNSGARKTPKSTYASVTDDNGIASIEHIPPSRGQLVGVEKEGLELPLSRDLTDWRVLQFLAEKGTVHELTIEMQPAGTEVRGRDPKKQQIADE